MARSKGSANLAASLEVLAGAPLDAREVVQAKADLTAQDSFPYKYIGLEVYVVAENKKYRLIGNDPTNIENWEEVGTGGGGGTTDYSDLDNKPQIEGVTLSGNKSASDLGLATPSDIPDPVQVSSMPTASADLLGRIVQFIGASDSTYINGYFYKCVLDGSTYKWEAKNVQAGGSGGTTDYEELSNKPSIGGVTLSGNKTASDLGLATPSDIPDDLADLNDDATHRLVTDIEKTTWNGKSTVSVSQVQSTGTKIATVNVNGTDTDLYAPSGGGGGSSDYNDLDNKPSVEGVTLSGNKTASDLGLDKARELTAVQYAALSEQEKMNGTSYFITDGGGNAYDVKKRTLTAGTTSVSMSAPSGDYLTNIYTSDGRDYLSASVSSGTLTITFEAPSADVDVYVEFRGV